MKNLPKHYRVVYTFHNSRYGFQNSITHFAVSADHALVFAMEEVQKTFGKRMFKRFTFKLDESFNHQNA